MLRTWPYSVAADQAGTYTGVRLATVEGHLRQTSIIVVQGVMLDRCPAIWEHAWGTLHEVLAYLNDTGVGIKVQLQA